LYLHNNKNNKYIIMRAGASLTVTREGFGRGGGWMWARPEAAEEEQAATPPHDAVPTQTEQPTPAVTSPPIQAAQPQLDEARERHL
jgi:hypothetical protein